MFMILMKTYFYHHRALFRRAMEPCSAPLSLSTCFCLGRPTLKPEGGQWWTQLFPHGSLGPGWRGFPNILYTGSMPSPARGSVSLDSPLPTQAGDRTSNHWPYSHLFLSSVQLQAEYVEELRMGHLTRWPLALPGGYPQMALQLENFCWVPFLAVLPTPLRSYSHLPPVLSVTKCSAFACSPFLNSGLPVLPCPPYSSLPL